MMNVLQSFGNGAKRLWMLWLLAGVMAGCSSVQSSDPVNPKHPYMFPGQVTSPAPAPAVSTPAPSTPAPVVSAPVPATPVTVAPAEAPTAPVVVQTTPVVPVVPQPAPPVTPIPTAPATVPPVTPMPAAAGGVSAGNAPNTVVLQAGDNLRVSFSDLPANYSLLPIDVELAADGKITLHHDVHVYALGKTARQLEQEIRSEYVPKYYRYLTVTIKTEMRFFHVSGEVKMPNQYPWRGQTSVLKAIATAGGLTDWARKKVSLTRTSGQKFTIDYDDAMKDATKDLPVYPGDLVDVPKKSWYGW